MLNTVINNLRNTFPNNNFTEIILEEKDLYVQEIDAIDAHGHKIKCTNMTEVMQQQRCFMIENKNNTPTAHICIDGDFIPYGLQKYDTNSDESKDGRPDSIVFNSSTFLFVELKLEQEDATFGKEKTKWVAFFKGVTQIENFVRFLRSNSFEVKNYYNSIYAVICMRFEPSFQSNAARNNEILRRSLALGFPIIAHNHQNKFILT